MNFAWQHRRNYDQTTLDKTTTTIKNASRSIHCNSQPTMSTATSSSDNVKIPKLINSKGFSLWSIYVMEWMRKDGILHILTEDAPDPNDSTSAVLEKYKREDQKDRPHIVLNIWEEPATLITSLLLSSATTKDVWKQLTDAYQKENIQSKLNLRTTLHNLRYKNGDCLLYTSPSPRDQRGSRMPSSA